MSSVCSRLRNICGIYRTGLASIKSEKALKALKEHTSIERNEKVRSSLLEAVYTMESTLLPRLNIPIPDPVIIEKSREV